MTTTQPRTMTWSSIRARYVGPTNHRDARVIVTDDRSDVGMTPRRLVLRWDRDKVRDADNFAEAAQAWLDKYVAPDFDKCKPVLKPDGYVFGGDYFWSWNMVSVDQ